MKINRTLRAIHKWGSIIISVPLLCVLVTGTLLMFKKDLAWIQPSTMTAVGSGVPALSMEDILSASRTVPEAEIRSWDDIDRVDIRPAKGVVKVQSQNLWEIQLDANAGHVLQAAYRRSDIIESLHDGSYFGYVAKRSVFLPSGIILFVLWLTGLYLFLRPYVVKARMRKASAKGV